MAKRKSLSDESSDDDVSHISKKFLTMGGLALNSNSLSSLSPSSATAVLNSHGPKIFISSVPHATAFHLNGFGPMHPVELGPALPSVYSIDMDPPPAAAIQSQLQSPCIIDVDPPKQLQQQQMEQHMEQKQQRQQQRQQDSRVSAAIPALEMSARSSPAYQRSNSSIQLIASPPSDDDEVVSSSSSEALSESDESRRRKRLLEWANDPRRALCAELPPAIVRAVIADSAPGCSVAIIPYRPPEFPSIAASNSAPAFVNRSDRCGAVNENAMECD